MTTGSRTIGSRREWLRPGTIATAIVATYACYFAWTCAQIVVQSGRDEARAADAIVVFGAAEYFGKPSPDVPPNAANFTWKTLWKATDQEASYSSPVLADINGARHALFFTRAGLVDADPATGKVRYQFPWRARSTPLE